MRLYTIRQTKKLKFFWSTTVMQLTLSRVKIIKNEKLLSCIYGRY